MLCLLSVQSILCVVSKICYDCYAVLCYVMLCVVCEALRHMLCVVC
jgi:hypothetical protein